jgi:hypothetical protein
MTKIKVLDLDAIAGGREATDEERNELLRDVALEFHRMAGQTFIEAWRATAALLKARR